MSQRDDDALEKALLAEPPLENSEQLIALFKAGEQLYPKQILYNPLIFQIIQKELDKKIVGELEARHTILLTALGSLVTNRTASSFNLMINSKSGAGKDYVAQKVLDIFPNWMVHRRTRISPAAFTYWHNSKYEPQWTWDNKICYLQDISNSVLNCDVFKVMVSEGSHATIVKEQRAIDIEIKGKPAMIITTTNTTPVEEMLRRFPIIELDETEEQTKAIMLRWGRFSKNGGGESYDAQVKAALGRLKPQKVLVPYAEVLAEHMDANNVILRTNFIRLMDYIKASAALHQYQRKLTEFDTAIVAEPIDYEFARLAIQATLSNPHHIPLTKKQKRLLQVMEGMEGEWHKVSEIRAKATFLSQKTLYKYLDTLAEFFFDVESRQGVRDDGEPTGKPYMVYKLQKVKDVKLLQLGELGEFLGGNYTNYTNYIVNMPTYLSLSKNITNGKGWKSSQIGINGINVIKVGFVFSDIYIEGVRCVLCGLSYCNYTHKITQSHYCSYCADEVEKGLVMAK